MGKIEKLARPEIAQLAPYICARDLYKEAEAFMDANENSFGGSVGPVEGLELNRYPDSDQNELRDELAAYAGVTRENVLVGNGSDEIISLCVRAFVERGDSVVTLEPGYSMYGVCARAEGAEVREVPLDSDFQPDVDAILQACDAKTKIVFLVSPNSPVGVPVKKGLIAELAEKSDSIVFVDEAYIEFGGESCTDLAGKYENLVVSRTFSKAWGLAGIRVGYAIADAKAIALLRRLKPPYNVNVLSAALATRALKKGREMMNANLAKMREGREGLAGKLRGVGFEVFPSVCNFLLVRPPLGGMAAGEMQKEIAAKGLIVRDRSSMPMIPNTFRITVGTPEQNRKLTGMIEGLVKQGGKYDCVLFDMDGVLVDVRQSYRKAIEETANWYLQKTGSIRRVSQEDASLVKTVVGFNNDWDATYAVVSAAQNGAKMEEAAPLTPEEKASPQYRQLKEKFQSIYIGGLIQKEIAIVKKETLERLANSGMKLGIVTGRPRKEAEFAVEKNGWGRFFLPSSIVSLDDCEEEKPSPKPLLLAARRLFAKKPLYVGDNVSDAAAAKAAGMPCIIVGKAARGDWNAENTDDVCAVIG